ncbi:hypothetical protein [Nocardiopsis kunsanensis]|uniref:Uncharacterized protein n=1 Tax=Nocardiopsis kunsanensis TaxID=141693 RepID=A0A919CHB7_9ACTN|nr:hypothetical protein [Nocardiopsis kunsanensis]GHD25145.1 hypothetical protein GCM10007147_22080 [Nocardiopsis kunsanensis]
MDDEQLFDELLRRLNSEGDSAEYSDDRSGVLLHRFQGTDHDPPFVLHVDARTLGEHLRSMGGLRELFPDESPDISALQLFLVRVMETVDLVLSSSGASDSDRRHLVPVASGVSSRTEPPVSS